MKQISVIFFMLLGFYAGAIEPDYVMPIQYSDEIVSNGITEAERINESGHCFNITEAEIYVYLPKGKTETSSCVVLFPGGGYNFVTLKSAGFVGAEFFVNNGIAAVVVKYRLPNGNINIPLVDGQQVIRMIRHNAGKWNINPNKVGICGSSAGGHLVSMLAVHTAAAEPESEDALKRYSSRPDFLILLKAAIYASRGDTMRNARGENPTEERYNFCNALNFVDETHMPTFIAHCADDPAAPVIGVVDYFVKLKELNVPCEMHIFQEGKHSIGYYKNAKPMSAWLDMLLKWKYLY